MRIQRHQYTERLFQAAEDFLVEQFASPTQFTEASHLPDLVDAAMHIVTGAAWIQTDNVRRYASDAAVDDERDDYDEGEDEEGDE